MLIARIWALIWVSADGWWATVSNALSMDGSLTDGTATAPSYPTQLEKVRKRYKIVKKTNAEAAERLTFFLTCDSSSGCQSQVVALRRGQWRRFCLVSRGTRATKLESSGYSGNREQSLGIPRKIRLQSQLPHSRDPGKRSRRCSFSSPARAFPPSRLQPTDDVPD